MLASENPCEPNMSTPSPKRIASLTMFLLCAAQTALAADNNGMVGRWFAEGVENGAHIQVFLENKIDGTYLKDVRAVNGCETRGAGKETGIWTFEKGDYATEAKQLDGMQVTGSFADTHDLFTVTRVDEDHINLYDTETNLTWALSRESATASFPAPRGCTGI
jgi:hypothetical protein